jgi:hypothetical protein
MLGDPSTNRGSSRRTQTGIQIERVWGRRAFVTLVPEERQNLGLMNKLSSSRGKQFTVSCNARTTLWCSAIAGEMIGIDSVVALSTWSELCVRPFKIGDDQTKLLTSA